MAKQADISSFFSSKKSDAIQKAFIREYEKCNEIEEEADKSSWAFEKNRLENEIKTLRHEKNETITKYEKLKKKHVELLQTLFSLEKKNQDLELKLHKSMEEKKCVSDESAGAAECTKSATGFELAMLTELVCISMKKCHCTDRNW